VTRVYDYVAAVRKLGPFSGVILSARDGRILINRAFGMANFEDEIPNTPETRFRIASVTKPFTATSILMLHERGKLGVKDPACRYVSPCPEAWRPITIEHLLTHTSGIPNYSNFSEYALTQAFPATPQALVERFQDKPLEFEPGSRFEYSNSGYVLLGYILERVSRQTYEEFLRTNIFGPLKMDRTGYGDSGLWPPHRAEGYIWRGELRRAAHLDPSVSYASGGLYSTAADLFAFDEAFHQGRLVSARTIDRMLTPFRDDYGYGWKTGRQFGRREVGHDGSVDGFRASLVRFPDERLLVVVLANIECARLSEITQTVAAIALGERYVLSDVRCASVADEPQAIQVDSSERGIGRTVPQIEGRVSHRGSGRDSDHVRSNGKPGDAGRI
jgi:CubicO group peptidase (beta-lactamase class C family)